MTNIDLILMYLVFLALNDKGFHSEDILTFEENQKFLKLIKKNKFSEELETIVLLEYFNELLIKAGIRFCTPSEYVN